MISRTRFSEPLPEVPPCPLPAEPAEPSGGSGGAGHQEHPCPAPLGLPCAPLRRGGAGPRPPRRGSPVAAAAPGAAGARGGGEVARSRAGGGAERRGAERSAAPAADRRHPGPTRASRSGKYPALPGAEYAPGCRCSPSYWCSSGVPRAAARRLHRCEHRPAISWVPVLTLLVNEWGSAGSQRRGIAQRPAARRGKVIPCALNARSPALLSVLLIPRESGKIGEKRSKESCVRATM